MTRFLLAALAFVLIGCRGQAAAPPPIVRINGDELPLTGRVVDTAALIPDADEKAISNDLERLEKDTTDQLVVVTLRSLNGVPIEKVGRSLGNGWGIGRKGIDNGVLLIVAPNDRKVRVEVGYGLEGLLTDQRAAGVIRDMMPLFRQNRRVEAIEVGTREISQILESDKTRPQRLKKEAA